MDFFSTGGFQQLFKELNCADEIYASEDFNNFSLLPSAENIALQALDDDLQFYIDNNNDQSLENTYQILNITESVTTDINLHSLTKDVENSDWLDNLLSFNDQNSCQTTDYMLPIATTDIASTVVTETLIAEWEDKFLDNFIEIPELIDILPEKTPLCTDTCELFLRESTENLKLDRAAATKSLELEDTDKGYVCTFGSCCKIYAKPAHLKAHMRRHLGEKPYVCTWPSCTWKFSRSDELARHRRSHSGVKPYKCDYCLKCFARSDHLTKHRKVHERRLLAATEAGILPQNVFHVRPGRRRKNAI